jgi:putative ABC transport system permease protein
MASLVAISLGIFAGGVSAVAVAALLAGGVLGLFAGIALLAPRLVKPLARVVGWPARRIGGVAGDLAGANSVRNPGRTASTAAALMIGLTLVTVVAVLGQGLRSATQSAVADQINADYVVDGKQQMPFRAAEGARLERVAGVEAATHVRSDTAIVQGEESTVSGLDPATIERFYRFDWSQGSEHAVARLGTGGALVTTDYAKQKDLKVGSRVSIETPSGAKRTVVVRGTYKVPYAKELLGQVSVSQTVFDKAFTQPKNSLTLLDADPSAGAAIKSAADGFGDAAFHTGAAYPKDATKDMATLLAMLYVLLGFSVIVSLFGMVNTMVLSVFERTRELGMLRTIGMTRRQARRMIRHESVITALIGATMGLGLGVFLSVLVTQAVGSQISLSIPWPTLGAFTLVAVVAGIGAAIMPARRASKLNVLDALHYE